jgi:integral membrane sensor domain MASE1
VLERGIRLSTIFATCDVAELIVIAGLIARYFGDDFALDQLHEVFGFLGATIAETTQSSLGGAVASRLLLGPKAEILTTWLHWWTRVAVGVVTVAPVISDWRERPPSYRESNGCNQTLVAVDYRWPIATQMAAGRLHPRASIHARPRSCRTSA